MSLIKMLLSSSKVTGIQNNHRKDPRMLIMEWNTDKLKMTSLTSLQSVSEHTRCLFQVEMYTYWDFQKMKVSCFSNVLQIEKQLVFLEQIVEKWTLQLRTKFDWR